MKIIDFKSFAFLLCILSTFMLRGTNYYVGNDGNNNNKGTTLSAPVADVQELITRGELKPGDSIFLMNGNYQGFEISRFRGMKDGTLNAPVVFKGMGENVNITQTNPTTDGISINGVKHIILEDINLLDLPRRGIDIEGSNFITIRNTWIEGSREAAILAECSNNLLIENNRISNTLNHGINIANSADNHIIRFNTLEGNRLAGLQIDADKSIVCQTNPAVVSDGVISNVSIYGNTIHNNGRDGAAGLNLDGTIGVKIFNNLLYNNLSTGLALYGDDAARPSDSAFVANNTIINGNQEKGRWAVLIQAKSVNFYNNYVWNNHPIKGSLGIETWAMPSFNESYNLLDGRIGVNGDDINSITDLFTYQNQFDKGQQSRFAPSPSVLFINAENMDFRLQENSIGIDAGTDKVTEILSTDLVENTRPQGNGFDIGAYEFPIEQTAVMEEMILGTCIDAELANPSDVGNYQSEGWEKDDVVYVKVSSNSFIRPKVRILLNGDEIAVYDENSFVAELSTAPLPTSGKITILVEDKFTDNDGAYNLFIERLNNPISAQPLVCNTTEPTALTCSAMSRFYSFSGKKDTKLLVKGNSNSFVRACLKIFDAKGEQKAIKCENAFDTQIEYTLPEDGCYYIALSDNFGRQTGAVSISLTLIDGTCTEDCGEEHETEVITEICDNNLDDNGDGLIDCQDTIACPISVNPNCQETPQNGILTFMIDQIKGNPFDTVLIPIRAEFFSEISGFSFSLSMENLEIGTFIDIVDGTLNNVLFDLKSGELVTIVWINEGGALSLLDNEILFYLKAVLNANSEQDCSIITFETEPTPIDAVQVIDDILTPIKPITFTGELCLQDETTITVKVALPTNEVVANVTINCNEDIQTTNEKGTAIFENRNPIIPYTIEPSKEMNPLNGISTLDAVLILSHILDANPLESPYSIIAADVNKDGLISIIDVVYIQHLIIQKIAAFPIDNWRFVDKDFEFTDAKNPLEEEIPYTKVVIPTTDTLVQFVAIKVGDVNHTATPSNIVRTESRAKTKGNTAYLLDDIWLAKGEIVEIPIALDKQENGLLALQSKFQIKPNFITPITVASTLPDFNDENWYSHPKHPDFLNIAWFSWHQNFEDLESATITLTFKVLQQAYLSEVLQLVDEKRFNNESYSKEGHAYTLGLVYQNTTLPTVLVAPNPFSHQITIRSFFAPEGFSNLFIYDAQGRVLFAEQKDLSKEHQEWKMQATTFSKPGIYFYKITSQYQQQSGKLIYQPK